MEAKVGLILGDSILHDYFEHDSDLIGAMRKNFDLDSLVPIFDKGKSIEFLVRNTFPRQMAEILNQYHGDAMVDVFLVAGAVDLSDSISEDLQYDQDRFISQMTSNFKIVMDHHLVRRLFVYPLTPRKICLNELKMRFPKYGNPEWIEKANYAIQYANEAHFQFHSKLRLVPPLPVSKLTNKMSRDGIHLTGHGKKIFARSILNLTETPTIFSTNDFPGLPLKRNCVSPLKPLDFQIADLEKKLREKRASRAILTDTKNRLVKNEVFVSAVKTQSCSSPQENAKNLSDKIEKVKTVPRKQHKKLFDYHSMGSPMEAPFSNHQIGPILKRCGEDKKIDRMVRNISRCKQGNYRFEQSFFSQPNTKCLSTRGNISLRVDPFLRQFDPSQQHTCLGEGISIRESVRPLLRQSSPLPRCVSHRSRHFLIAQRNALRDEHERLKKVLHERLLKFFSERKPFLHSHFHKKKFRRKNKKFIQKSSPSESFNGDNEEKIRFTFHSKHGIRIEHVKQNDHIEIFFDSLNLVGGGKRTASQERAKKKKQRVAKELKLSEEEKKIAKEKENERICELRKAKLKMLDEEECEQARNQET